MYGELPTGEVVGLARKEGFSVPYHTRTVVARPAPQLAQNTLPGCLLHYARYPPTLLLLCGLCGVHVGQV
jgi:hypothetical protein